MVGDLCVLIGDFMKVIVVGRVELLFFDIIEIVVRIVGFG